MVEDEVVASRCSRFSLTSIDPLRALISLTKTILTGILAMGDTPNTGM